MKINWKLFLVSVAVLTSSLLAGVVLFLGLVLLAETLGFGAVIVTIVGLAIVIISLVLSYETK